MFELEVWQAPITDNQGNILPGAQITVFNSDDTVATIYDDLDRTPKDNPFTVGTDALARFYAEPGRYRVQAQSGTDIAVYDNVDLSQKALRDDLAAPDSESMIAGVEARELARLNELPIAGTFESGFTITDKGQFAIFKGAEADGSYIFRWDGALPKEVPANSSPDTTGGVDVGAWVDVGQAALRSEINDPSFLGALRSTNYTSNRAHRKGGLNAKSLHLTVDKVRPVVVFIDDDGHNDFLTKLKPIFDSKSIKAGLSITTSFPDNQSGYMGWGQIKSLYDEGYEILSHSVSSNFDGISEQDAEFQLSQSRKDIESRGMEVESFVYVQGILGSLEVQDLTRRYYRAGFRTSLTGIQPVPLEDYTVRRLNAVGQSVEDNLTLQELKDLVDYAEQNNELAVFTTHAFYNGLDSNQLQVISDLIDYIQSKNIDILTPSKALDVHGSKLFVGTTDDFGARNQPLNNFFKIDKNGKSYPSGARFDIARERTQQSPITDFEPNQITVFRPPIGDDWELVGGGNTATVETHRVSQQGSEFGYQRITRESTGESVHRAWNRSSNEWGAWVRYETSQYIGGISDASKPIFEYEADKISIERVPSSAVGFPESGTNTAGLLVTFYGRFDINNGAGYQTYTANRVRDGLYTRTWDYSANEWREFQKNDFVGSIDVSSVNDAPELKDPSISKISLFTSAADNAQMPEGAQGTLFRYRGSATYFAYDIYHVARTNRRYQRFFDVDNTGQWSSWERISGGASGAFTSSDGKTVTVENGIVTDIS